MTNTPAWHKHTTSSSEIYGTLLEPGDVLEDLDCYDSPNGTWALYLMPGLLVGYGSVHIWVRPVAPLTNDDLIEIRDGMLAISEPSVSQQNILRDCDIALRVVRCSPVTAIWANQRVYRTTRTNKGVPQ